MGWLGSFQLVSAVGRYHTVCQTQLSQDQAHLEKRHTCIGSMEWHTHIQSYRIHEEKNTIAMNVIKFVLKQLCPAHSNFFCPKPANIRLWIHFADDAAVWVSSNRSHFNPAPSPLTQTALGDRARMSTKRSTICQTTRPTTNAMVWDYGHKLPALGCISQQTESRSISPKIKEGEEGKGWGHAPYPCRWS